MATLCLLFYTQYYLETFGYNTCHFTGLVEFKLEMALIKDSVVDSSIHIVFNDEDIPFEEELLRNPHSLKSWLRYIEARSDAPNKFLNLLYERALKELPGSYKIWNSYLLHALTIKNNKIRLN